MALAASSFRRSGMLRITALLAACLVQYLTSATRLALQLCQKHEVHCAHAEENNEPQDGFRCPSHISTQGFNFCLLR